MAETGYSNTPPVVVTVTGSYYRRRWRRWPRLRPIQDIAEVCRGRTIVDVPHWNNLELADCEEMG